MIKTLVLSLLLLTTGALSATTIDPYTRQQLLSQADLVAELECTRAGGIVAEYKILKSWRGMKEGDIVRIRVTPNYWGPQFPLALVGQRWLVTASNANPYARMMSTTSGGAMPLWWRELDYDYLTPLFQGRWLVSPDDPEEGYAEDEKKWVDELYADFDEFFEADAVGREALILTSVAVKRLRYFGEDELEEKTAAVLESLDGILDPAKVAEKLIAYARGEAAIAEKIGHVLREAGGEKTADYLDEIEKKELPFSPEQIAKAIRPREAVEDGESEIPEESDPEEPEVTEDDIAKWNKDFAAGEDADYEAFWTAFEGLLRNDPAPVIQWAVKYENQGDHWSSDEQPYGLGSYIAHFLGEDRKQNLTALLEADEDGIAISAAVYLCFEDRKAGEEALKEYASRHDRGGWWAALTLARRGEKTVMPDLLKIFGFDPEGGMQGMPVDVLKQRVMVLLSNSAAQSGVAQPPSNVHPEKGETALEAREKAVSKWWKSVSDTIVLKDPWLEDLAEQKID